jgi:hypothetical protein
MSDDPVARILAAIDRLRSELTVRIDRLQGTPSGASDIGRAEIVAHVQNVGDVEGDLGTWIGERGSGRAIEGFSLASPQDIDPGEFVYQVVLGRDWRSPWVPSGKYCGSRGLALPLRGFCVNLQGAAAMKYRCSYSATFVDRSVVGETQGGRICAAATLAPLEAFQVNLRRIA